MAKRKSDRKRDEEGPISGTSEPRKAPKKVTRGRGAKPAKPRIGDDPLLDYDSIEEILERRDISAQEQHDLVMLFRARTRVGPFDADGDRLRKVLREREGRAREEQLEQKSRALAASITCGDEADTLAAAREFVKFTDGWTEADWELAEAIGF